MVVADINPQLLFPQAYWCTDNAKRKTVAVLSGRYDPRNYERSKKTKKSSFLDLAKSMEDCKRRNEKTSIKSRQNIATRGPDQFQIEDPCQYTYKTIYVR